MTDPASLRVHGVSGLRVVDASAMPYVTNGNIYAPVMMLTEKAADLIMGIAPLAAEPIPFYRHQSETATWLAGFPHDGTNVTDGTLCLDSAAVISR